MSWSLDQVDQFKSGLSEKQKKQWIGTANGVLRSCLENGSSVKSCEARAVKIANSKFETKLDLKEVDLQFMKSIQNVPPPIHRILKNSYQNSESTEEAWKKVYSKGWSKNEEGNWVKKKFDVTQIPELMTPDMKERLEEAVDICIESGGDPGTCLSNALAKLQTTGFSETESEEQKAEENIFEMEIFRIGTHNGDDFTEKDLQDIASNYHALKDELRPKLKITHRDTQDTLAGLASYGDIVDVFMKKVLDGSNRLFAKIKNAPNEVRQWIKDRRFPERSIELYPQFQLGTKEDSPIYKNVLKAVALLGHEMPAVTGMAPILMEECLECQGTVCFKESIIVKSFSVDETQKIKELSSGMKVLETELLLNTGGGE